MLRSNPIELQYKIHAARYIYTQRLDLFLLALVEDLLDLSDFLERGQHEIVAPEPDAAVNDVLFLKPQVLPRLGVCLLLQFANERLLGREDGIRAQKRRMGRVQRARESVQSILALEVIRKVNNARVVAWRRDLEVNVRCAVCMPA